MRFLMGSLGVALLVIACLRLSFDWMTGIFVIGGLMTIASCLPLRQKWLLGLLGLVSAVIMFTMFAWFFHGVAVAHEVKQWYELDEAAEYFTFLFGGFVMMLALSEFSCWMKGRDSTSKESVSSRLRGLRSRFNRAAIPD